MDMKKLLKLIGWIIRGIICIAWLPIIALCLCAILSDGLDHYSSEEIITGMVLSSIAFYTILFILLRLLKKQKHDFRLAVWIMLGLITLVFHVDRPEPELKYGAADLVVPEEYRASYETLMRYQKGGGNELSLTLPDELIYVPGTWTNLLPQAESIEQAWLDLEDGKQYIRDLDKHPEIADYIDFKGDAWDTPFPSFTVWRTIGRTYSLYAMLNAQQDTPEKRLKELAQLHSVNRKWLPHSTMLISKMITIAITKMNIQTADHIVCNTPLKRADLLFLKEEFTPLSYNEISLRRPILSAYWEMQYITEYCATDINEGLGLSSNNPASWKIARNFVFKKNQTKFDLKNLYEPLLEQIENQPNALAVTEIFDAKVDRIWTSSFKKIHNPVGMMIFEIGFPSFNKATQNTIKTKTYSDLLALEIHKRLGEELNLKDSYTSANYAYNDARQRFFCAGPDGQLNTGDDIYINEY